MDEEKEEVEVKKKNKGRGWGRGEGKVKAYFSDCFPCVYFRRRRDEEGSEKHKGHALRLSVFNCFS